MAKSILLTYFGYCALETTAGLWAASYLVEYRGVMPETAAQAASLFYLGITVGRFLSGFITLKLNNKNMIRLGQALIIIGLVFIILPFGNAGAYIGLVTVGLGCAPIYPSLLHSTPDHFGADVSQSIMGIQMASAYIGSTLMPPLFGFLQRYIGMRMFPVFLGIFILLMISMMEKVNRSRIAH